MNRVVCYTLSNLYWFYWQTWWDYCVSLFVRLICEENINEFRVISAQCNFWTNSHFHPISCSSLLRLSYWLKMDSCVGGQPVMLVFLKFILNIVCIGHDNMLSILCSMDLLYAILVEMWNKDDTAESLCCRFPGGMSKINTKQLWKLVFINPNHLSMLCTMLFYCPRWGSRTFIFWFKMSSAEIFSMVTVVNTLLRNAFLVVQQSLLCFLCFWQ